VPDWSLLQQPDFARAALGGYQAGREIGKQKRTDAALQLYAKDPSAGISALSAFDPQMAAQLTRASREQKQYEREETVRTGLIESYDPATGAIDPSKARSAYLKAGDIEGVMSYDKSRIATRKAELENALSQIETTSKLLSSATDPASYANARAQAVSLGLDVSNAPEQYDPAWVRNAQMQALDIKERLAVELADKKFRADQEERARDNVRQDAGLGIRREALNLARQREGRVASGKGGDGNSSDAGTDVLLQAAGL